MGLVLYFLMALLTIALFMALWDKVTELWLGWSTVVFVREDGVWREVGRYTEDKSAAEAWLYNVYPLLEQYDQKDIKVVDYSILRQEEREQRRDRLAIVFGRMVHA